MTATQIFQLVSTVSLVAPIVIAVAILFGLRRPRHVAARAIVAIFVAWIASIIYTALIYNPAGIASAIEQGIDSPVMKFDNNAIASTLLGGWIIPLATVCVFLVGRGIWQWHRNRVAET